MTVGFAAVDIFHVVNKTGLNNSSDNEQLIFGK